MEKAFLKINIFFKQYGFKNGLKRLSLKFLSSFLIVKEDIILAQTTRIKSNSNSRIEQMELANINSWLNDNIISIDEHKKFNYFLNKKCNGYYITDNNKLVAWGFVDSSGKYEYGGKYFYTIPPKVHILRNLFVKPEFRGKSFGKWINEARINNIPDGCIPVAFVIPENRYALRNLKMFGFEEILFVQHYCWFNKWERRKIKIIKEGKIADILLIGFKK